MIRRIPLFLAAALATAPALAQIPPRWYLGISGGESRTSHKLVENRESTVVNGSASSTDFDAKDGAWKVFGGLRVNPWLALEAGYTDLGRSTLVTHTVRVDGLEGAVAIRRKITALGADVLISAPLGPRFTVFGRGGAYRTKLKAEAQLDGGIVFTDGSPDERSRSTTFNETVPHFGAGLEWNWRPEASLRIEWERFKDVGKAFAVGATGTTGEADTDLASIGVLMRF